MQAISPIVTFLIPSTLPFHGSLARFDAGEQAFLCNLDLAGLTEGEDYIISENNLDGDAGI